MKAVVVANGEMSASARLQEIWQRADLRIAADGGARNARLYLERAPQVVIGDLDSMDPETRAWLDKANVEFIRYPPAKDETDLDLALLMAQERGANEITVLGALGGRVDHFLGNVLLLTRFPRVRAVDAASEMWVGSGDEEIVGNAGDTVSLLALSDTVKDIVTTALEYPLRSESLVRGSTRGISNVMLGERARVEWTRGILLVVHMWQTSRE